MPPAPAVQWKTIGRPIIAVRTILSLLGLSVLRRLLLRLIAGDEGRQPLDAGVAVRSLLLRTRLKVLLLRLLRLEIRLLIVMLLIVMLLLLARIIGLRLARRERLATHLRLFVALLVVLVGPTRFARLLLLLVVGLALPKLFLGRRDQAEIVLGVLVIVLRRNRIPGALRVTGELQIFFTNVRRCSTNFYVRPVGLVHSG